MVLIRSGERDRSPGTPPGSAPWTRLRGGLGGLAAVAVLALLGGCATMSGSEVVGPTEAAVAAAELPEEQLLDVGIDVFEPGEITEEQVKEQGIHKEIRDAESRFVPVHLKNTLQKTGHWGAVRVVPSRTDSVDLLISGEIQRSDGENLVLKVDVEDATGRRWFTKVYEAEVTTAAYAGLRRGHEDAFQDLYNTIANDLADYKTSLGLGELERIHQVAQIKFAEDLAPDAFAGYLKRDSDGNVQMSRLPADEDPMFRRVLLVREREYMLVDTVNAYYDEFYLDMWDPYVGWRKFYSEEAEQMREVKAQARKRMVLGAAAIVGAVALELMGRGQNTAGLRNVMLIGGAAAFKSGWDIHGQSRVHVDAIKELGESFQSEVQPLVVEVEGETVELTGSAETQYATWRALLRKIYLSETGLTMSDDNADGPAGMAPAGARKGGDRTP